MFCPLASHQNRFWFPSTKISRSPATVPSAAGTDVASCTERTAIGFQSPAGSPIVFFVAAILLVCIPAYYNYRGNEDNGNDESVRWYDIFLPRDDKEALEDSSKQGRMIKEIDQDAGVTLVTPTQGEDQPKDRLGVLSAAKILADAAKINVHTYTKRRRAVSTGKGGISTASRLFSNAEELVSIAGASMPVSTASML
ncbi:hypothetical protein Tco_1312505 [Tanacetum coccineum]